MPTKSPVLWIPLLLGGCLTIITPTQVLAQRLFSPQIFDELPASRSTQAMEKPEQVSPVLPNPSSNISQIEFNTPLPLITPTRSRRLYRVDIYGDSPLLLAQVRKIEPDAFVRMREGVIQAGLYGEEYEAQRRVQELKVEGILAQIIPISAVTRSINFNTSQPQITPTRSRGLYKVDISGDSPLLLAQVRKIEPDAFLRVGEGVIQAGVYGEEYEAQRRVQELEVEGILAQITPVSAVTRSNERSASSNSYFVAIPTSRADLANLQAQVVQLGFSQQAMSFKDKPRGLHLAIGPFADRTEAERWSKYLKSNNIDARVYYEN